MGRKSVSLRVIFVLVVVLSGVVSAGTYGGGSGTEIAPYLIADANHIQEIRDDSNDWDKHFLLTADINLAGEGDNPDGSFSIAVIAPDIDNSNYEFDGITFAGVFDGNDYKIINLTIDTDGADNDYLGLFGQIGTNGQVINLGLEDVNITGGNDSWHLGGLCGENYVGTIADCHARGSVTGGDNSIYLGGLCGANYVGTITDCYAICSVIGGNNSSKLGGLCGHNYSFHLTDPTRRGRISKCYATGDVQGGG